MPTKNNNVKKKVPSNLNGFFWLLVITIVFSELLAYVWVRTETTQTILRISRIQSSIETQTAYQKGLIVERDRLKSNDRITRIAKTKLNLVPDTSVPTIYLPGDNG